MNLLVELVVIFFAHLLFFCPRIARIDTKAMRYGYGDRVGRTNWH